DETTPRLFQYYVQNSRATDLAAVLNDVLASGGGGGAASRFAQTAPGTTAAALGSRIGSQPGGGSTGTGSSLPGGSASAPTGSDPSGATPGASATGGAQPQPLSTTSSAASAGRTTATLPSRAANRVSLGGGAGAAAGELETPVVRVVADDKNNALIIYARPRD